MIYRCDTCWTLYGVRITETVKYDPWWCERCGYRVTPFYGDGAVFTSGNPIEQPDPHEQNHSAGPGGQAPPKTPTGELGP